VAGLRHAAIVVVIDIAGVACAGSEGASAGAHAVAPAGCVLSIEIIVARALRWRANVARQNLARSANNVYVLALLPTEPIVALAVVRIAYPVVAAEGEIGILASGSHTTIIAALARIAEGSGGTDTAVAVRD